MLELFPIIRRSLAGARSHAAIAIGLIVLSGATGLAQAQQPADNVTLAKHTSPSGSAGTGNSSFSAELLRRASANRRTPLVEAVSLAHPAVVNIRGKKIVEDRDAFSVSESRKQVNGMGTGILLDRRGYVLTNYHVVQGVRHIRVTTHDDQTCLAELVAHDQATDLAVVRMTECHTDVPEMPIGNSREILIGESVAAIGNAYGYENTVTVGIVSQLHREVQVSEEQFYSDLIQTDTAINPGNSGGPLINMDGQMIGVNVAVRVNAQGIAFAIPANDVMEIAARLLDEVNRSRANSGMTVKTIYPDFERPFVVVETVDPNGPAQQAGIRKGDRLTHIAGQECSRAVDFQKSLLERQPGQSVSLTIDGRGGSNDVDLVLRPAATTDETQIWDALGVRLARVESKVMRNLTEGFEHGMQVVQIRKGSPADEADIRLGDIFVAMDGWKTETVANVAYILRQDNVANRQPFEFYMFRGRQPMIGKLQLAR